MSDKGMPEGTNIVNPKADVVALEEEVARIAKKHGGDFVDGYIVGITERYAPEELIEALGRLNDAKEPPPTGDE